MTDYAADLTQLQQNIVTFLNQWASYTDIAEQFDVSESTARDHISMLDDEGVPLVEDRVDGCKVFRLADQSDEYPVNPEFYTGEIRSKAAVTSDAKETVHALIQYLNDDLNGREPAMPDKGLTVRESHEDMVIHRSDDHAGALYHDEFGNEIYNADIFKRRMRAVSDKTFRLKNRQEQAGVKFDTAHILMGGDHVHGVGIHPDQPWETELNVSEQLAITSDLYMEFIDRASSEFESVQVVCQRGNHGELRGDGMGPDDNLDDALFMMLDKRVRDRDYDNVKFVQSQGGYFTNFPLRGNTLKDCVHQGHLRHGQNSLEHIGTSAGKKRWLQWLHQHGFDIAYRGHYHSFRIENISSKPVIESGAICPPADYEESLAEWEEPAATVHGASDNRPLTWFYPIDFAP